MDTSVAEANGVVNFDRGLLDSRTIWRNALASVAQKATAVLPDCAGRVEKALALALAGDVEILPDGGGRVASQRDGQTIYYITNGHCTCKDYASAPDGWCKHRLSVALVRRAWPLAKSQLDASNPAPAPVETPSIPAEYLTHLEAVWKQSLYNRTL
jgi:hypothetical protein